jgi:hypothetical protein
VDIAVVVLEVHSHQVLIGCPQAPRDGGEWCCRHDEQRDEGQQSVQGHRHRSMDGGQRGCRQEAQHAACLAQAVESLGNGRLAANDMGQPATREGHDQEADPHAVVAAAVGRLAEQPHSANEQHERQHQRHPAESAVDHGVDGIREPAPEAPPGKSGDENGQCEIEQGGPVTAVFRCEVTDVVADPPHSTADQVANSEPGTTQNPQQPRLPGFDGGKLARARRSAGCPAPAGFGRRGAGAAR